MKEKDGLRIVADRGIRPVNISSGEFGPSGVSDRTDNDHYIKKNIDYSHQDCI